MWEKKELKSKKRESGKRERDIVCTEREEENEIERDCGRERVC